MVTAVHGESLLRECVDAGVAPLRGATLGQCRRRRTDRGWRSGADNGRAAAQSDVVADAATAEKKPLQPERCRQAIGQTMALGSRR